MIFPKVQTATLYPPKLKFYDKSKMTNKIGFFLNWHITLPLQFQGQLNIPTCVQYKLPNCPVQVMTQAIEHPVDI